MENEKKSLYQRIRNARKSLENAEKSFQDDKDMRGELDLMLAEAELKNLRNKQAFPFSWNRNVLAATVAMMLVVASFVGWMLAKEKQDNQKLSPAVNSEIAETINSKSDISKKQEFVEKENLKTQNDADAKVVKEDIKVNKVQLSDRDMRNLVRKAKSELNSGK